MREQGRARGGGGSREASIAAGSQIGCFARNRFGRRGGGSTLTWPASGAGGARRDDARLGDRRGRQRGAVSTSTGSGSGVIVPGTGLYLNNMLGEYDLSRPAAARRGRG